MPEPAIELNQVSKRYRLRRGWQVTSLRDEIARLGARILRHRVPPREEFWALRDVTFSLKRGDVLGLVGVNGAGKSTLLKILSRVTVPTSGTFSARGRVGALIEVGAGFHPELSGRENVYLNGSIMGMGRREIQEKFDRIVAFAEIDRFIDTPIKFYSSGMQMRLGFAVAAHTDPDILLIDEILAVGDASFQAKCLNKLAELKAQEKTIVLVSHSLSNITENAKTVVWLDAGRVRMTGEPDEVVNAYLEHVTAGVSAIEASGSLAPASGASVHIIEVATFDDQDRSQVTFDRGDRVHVDITFGASCPLDNAVFGVSFHDVHGYPLGGVVTDPDAIKVSSAIERGVLRLSLDPLLFNRGSYSLDVHVRDAKTRAYLALRRRAARIVVDGLKARGPDGTGYIYYPHQWESLR